MTESKERLYHPCKETCSGYKQGYEDGQIDVRDSAEWKALGAVVDVVRRLPFIDIDPAMEKVNCTLAKLSAAEKERDELRGKHDTFLAEHDENVRLHFENIDLKEKLAVTAASAEEWKIKFKRYRELARSGIAENLWKKEADDLKAQLAVTVEALSSIESGSVYLDNGKGKTPKTRAREALKAINGGG